MTTLAAEYRPEDPYCPRCGVHVGDKTDLDGESVCRFCRGQDRPLVEGTTVCSTCAVPEVEAELRSRAWDAEHGVDHWRDWHDDWGSSGCTGRQIVVGDARKGGSGLLAETCWECGCSRVVVYDEEGQEARRYVTTSYGAELERQGLLGSSPTEGGPHDVG